MSEVCTPCKGSGRRKIGFFRTKVCSTCNGRGYVKAKPAPVQENSISDTRNYADDGITRVDLANMARQHSQEEFSGKGGTFGGAGASANWDDSNNNSNNNADTPASPSDSSSSSSGND